MKKAGAVAILTTIFLGFFAWSATAIIQNKVNISRIDQKEIHSRELLKEMRSDIKLLLIRTK